MKIQKRGEKMQDRDIIELIKNGDPEGIKLLLEHYRPLMHYIIFPILADERELEECISDITFLIWNKIDRYDSNIGSFKTWLCALTRNAALNRLRKNNRINTNEQEIDESLPSSVGNPEEELIKKEQKEQLNDAINSLPLSEKALFYRKYYYMQSVSQIASELGITERAVEGRLYRIKKTLRNKLGGDVNG